MTTAQASPNTGDMFRCEKCQLELHVTKGCECEKGCVQLICCGQAMKEVTSPPVQNR